MSSKALALVMLYSLENDLLHLDSEIAEAADFIESRGGYLPLKEAGAVLKEAGAVYVREATTSSNGEEFVDRLGVTNTGDEVFDYQCLGGGQA